MKNLLALAATLLMANAQAATQSSFNEVWNVVTDVGFEPHSNIEIQEFTEYARQNNPTYPVNAQSVFTSRPMQLERDSQRTINQDEDYYDRIEKLLHPNGVCVAGEWEAIADSAYTGLFAKGQKALFVGRISVTMGTVLASDDDRGFGFAGKLFATTDADQKIQTANFFSVDVLLGTDARRMLDVKLTNEPETGFDLSLIGLGLKIGSALKTGDENPGFRPLYPIAKAGMMTDPSLSKHPKWFRLRADKGTIKNNEDDFRNEILKAMEQNREIRYFVDVSDKNKDRNKERGWQPVAQITLNKAVVSYGCDRRLHFAHPRLTAP